MRKFFENTFLRGEGVEDGGGGGEPLGLGEEGGGGGGGGNHMVLGGTVGRSVVANRV